MQQLITCYACKSDRVITDHESGEIICDNCGVIISDSAREKQVYAFSTTYAYAEGHNVEPHTSLARHDMGLSTIIGTQNIDADGHILDAATRCRMERLRTWDLRIKATCHNNRNLIFALNQLQTLKDRLGLSDTLVEKTAYIYRKAHKKGLVRGRTISAVLATAVYITCRELGIPKTLKEIADVTNTKRKTLAKCYRQLISELDIKIPMVDSTKCIVKVANRANLNKKTKYKAVDIMCYLNRKQISAGKDPMGIAATALYIACLSTGEKRTQTDIAHAAGITEVTLRNRFREIKTRKFDLVPIHFSN
jgi:transcription initiation factor TFIIB